MGATFPLVFDSTFGQNPDWLIDGEEITRQVSETVTNRTLQLEFRVTTSLLENKLRPLKSDEGKVDVVPTDDGGFRAVDRAGGDNTYQIDPPDKREPLRQGGEFHVARYEESLVSQAVGEWQVELELIRDRDRTDDGSVAQPVGGAAFPMVFDATFDRRSDAVWRFETPNGPFWTDRVDAAFVGTGEQGVRRFEITMRVTRDEAYAFETAYPRLGGGRVREIPDAPNVAVDDTADDAVTITIDAPGTGEVPDGDYLVTEWESTRLSEAYQEISMTVAQQ